MRREKGKKRGREGERERERERERLEAVPFTMNLKILINVMKLFSLVWKYSPRDNSVHLFSTSVNPQAKFKGTTGRRCGLGGACGHIKALDSHIKGISISTKGLLDYHTLCTFGKTTVYVRTLCGRIMYT